MLYNLVLSKCYFSLSLLNYIYLKMIERKRGKEEKINR